MPTGGGHSDGESSGTPPLDAELEFDYPAGNMQKNLIGDSQLVATTSNSRVELLDAIASLTKRRDELKLVDGQLAEITTKYLIKLELADADRLEASGAIVDLSSKPNASRMLAPKPSFNYRKSRLLGLGEESTVQGEKVVCLEAEHQLPLADGCSSPRAASSRGSIGERRGWWQREVVEQPPSPSKRLKCQSSDGPSASQSLDCRMMCSPETHRLCHLRPIRGDLLVAQEAHLTAGTRHLDQQYPSPQAQQNNCATHRDQPNRRDGPIIAPASGDHDRQFHTTTQARLRLPLLVQKMSYRCHVCGSGFEDRHRLRQHLSIHLNLRSSWFEEATIEETMAQYELRRGDYWCSACSLRFSTTAEFDRHMQAHGAKPHQCELCPRNKLVSFRYYRQLLTHLRSHCFLYSCKFSSDCRQTANRKDYLKLHILKHHLNNRLPEQHTICCHRLDEWAK